MVLRIGCIVLLALALVGASRNAAAHAVLVESTPPDGAQLTRAPDEIRLVFNEPVAPISIRLLDAAGKDIAAATFEAIDRTVILRPSEALAPGGYLVSYRVTSQDSHAVGGSIVFAVGVAAVPPVQTAAATESGWRVAVGANRFLWTAFSLTVAGLAMFIALCGGTLAPDGARRLERRLRTAALAALPPALLAVGFAGGSLLDAKPSDLLAIDAWRVGSTTTLARSMAVGVAGLALSAWAAAPGSSHALLAARIAGMLLIIGSFGLTGHAATVAPAIAMGPMVAVHAALAAFWWGSLLGLREALRDTAPGTAAPTVRRFSRTAVVAVAVLLALGAAIALVQVRHAAALVETRYGVVLCGKLLLVAALLAIASCNRLRLLPRLVAGEGSAARNLRGSVGLEIGLMAAVLALTALLGQTPPPRSFAAAVLTARAMSNNTVATIEVAPGRVGPNEVFLQLTDAAGRPLVADEAVLAAAQPSTGIEPIRRTLHAVAAGRYHLPELILPLPGHWTIRIEALVSDFDKRSLTVEVQIPR
jgi:copper transport protein